MIKDMKPCQKALAGFFSYNLINPNKLSLWQK